MWGGGVGAPPRRPAEKLHTHPASTKRIRKPEGCAPHYA
jgi:hypothetical protein